MDGDALKVTGWYNATVLAMGPQGQALFCFVGYLGTTRTNGHGTAAAVGNQHPPGSAMCKAQSKQSKTKEKYDIYRKNICPAPGQTQLYSLWKGEEIKM